MINHLIKTIFSKQQARLLALLAIPLILTGFMESSVGFFGTLFLARLGPVQLAAGAVVTWVFFTILVIIWGTLSSVSVLIAQAYGEKDPKTIAIVFRDGMLLAALMAVPTVLLLRNLSPLLIMVGQKPELVAIGQAYLDAVSWAMFVDLFSIVLMQFLIGLGHTRSNMIFSFSIMPLNIFFNYVFVFGKFGAPELGVAGIGWGTCAAFIILAISLTTFISLKKTYRQYTKGFFVWKKPQYLLELIQIGLPMGAMYCIEVAFFLTLTLIMGKFGNSYLAANQITMQYLGIVSVVTFSLAQAVTVRIGHTINENQRDVVMQITTAGVWMAGSFMICVSCMYIFFPELLLSIDFDLHNPKNAEIIMHAKSLLFFGAFFQIVESARFILFGALRGFKDTRFTLLISILSFWGISLTVGSAFAFWFGWGASGLWAATIIGQVFAVIILFYRLRFKVRSAARHAIALQN
jgi:MATE family multidrug resistance protein